jgi:antitoxin VapB
VPLYIRDDEVGQLARDVQAASGARTMTDAVRAALERELDRLKESLPPSARLGKALALADAMGPSAP